MVVVVPEHLGNAEIHLKRWLAELPEYAMPVIRKEVEYFYVMFSYYSSYPPFVELHLQSAKLLPVAKQWSYSYSFRVLILRSIVQKDEIMPMLFEELEAVSTEHVMPDD